MTFGIKGSGSSGGGSGISNVVEMLQLGGNLDPMVRLLMEMEISISMELSLVMVWD